MKTIHEVRCPKCGEYYGGHATGGDDICDCHMHKKVFEFYNWQFEWKLQDFWIGAFWKRTGNTVDLWICLIPCVPLHVSWGWHDLRQ